MDRSYCVCDRIYLHSRQCVVFPVPVNEFLAVASHQEIEKFCLVRGPFDPTLPTNSNKILDVYLLMTKNSWFSQSWEMCICSARKACS
jgi:hypothetical protein